MLKRWLSRGKDKAYEPEAWEQHLPTEELQDVYDAQGWSGPRGQWRVRSVERLTARILELYEQLGREVTVLDVACFSGDYFGQLAKNPELEGKFRYTGADVTPKYVANAAERWKSYPNAQFKVGSALELPFEANSFDLVFNSGMLIHVAEVEQCLAELARVADRYVLVETKVNPEQSEDFIDENKSGPKFIDRVYRADYIRGLLGKYAAIAEESAVKFYPKREAERQNLESILFEATPNP